MKNLKFKFFCFSILTLCCTSAFSSSLELTQRTYSLSQIHQKFSGKEVIDTTSALILQPRIIQKSEKIFVISRQLSVVKRQLSLKDYSIDYANGMLFLNIPIHSQDTILCVYERLPFNLSREYYNRKLPQDTDVKNNGQEIKDENQFSRTNSRESNMDHRLFLSGTKTFGISVGSRHNPSLEQSMQIQLDGKLSPGMQIEGTLRDDGIPLDPEGTTQELKEMDEMFLNIHTSKNEVRLGDFDLSISHSKFGELQKKQEGILGKIGDHTLLSGALSKGKWTHKEFEGVTGKQGPYELLSQYVLGGIVVAGSERVWVNGKLVTRGKDYTIDYSQATITFTPKFSIEDNDRIIAEFQQKNEGYRRSLFMADHKNAQGFRTLLLKENDMQNSPIAFTLTSERKKSLSAADSTEIWVSGASPSDKGSYIKTDSIYEYVGYPNGDYEVSFSRVTVVDSSEGDYDFDPLLGGYWYVGKGNGDYISKIKVVLPQSNSLLSIGYDKILKQSRNSEIKLDIEGGATKFNSNTFNKDEQIGKAFVGEISIGNNRESGRQTNWGVATKIRNLDESFHFPGTSDTLPLKSLELSGTVSPFPPLSTSAQVIKTADDFIKGAGVGLTLLDFPNLSYQYLAGKLYRTDEFITSYNIVSVIPFIRLQECKYEPESQTSNHEISRTASREIGVKNKYLNLGILEKNVYNYEPQLPSTKYRTSSIAISKMPFNLYYAYKQKFEGNYASAMDLGTLTFSHRVQKLVSTNLAYNLTSLERKSFQEEYYRVQAEQGSFSLDSLTGKYYPNSHGDYEKKLVTSGEVSIYKNFSFSHSFILTPSQDFSVRFAATKRGEGRKILFWERAQNAYEDRNRINIIARGFEIYANYIKEDWRENKNIGNDYLMTAPTSGNQEILEINFRHTFLDLSYTTSQTNQWEQSFLVLNEQANAIGIGFTSCLSSFTSHFSLEGEERKITEYPYSLVQLYGYSGEPTLIYELDNKRFETQVKVTNWLSDTPVSPSVRVMYPPGITTEWGIELMFFSKTRTNYTISYQGTKTPDYPTDHSLSADLSINF